jgi:peptidoglycan lytic transglycosylase G
MSEPFERTAEEREAARAARNRYRRPRGSNGRTAPPRRRPMRPRRKHSWVSRFVAVFLLVVAAALIWFLIELFQPFHGSPHGSVTVTVPAHSTAREVGDELAKAGVVSSGFFFEVRATLAGERSDLRAGTYHLQQGMTYAAVLKRLTAVPPAAKTTNITIIEGRTRAQINALLRSQGVPGSYFAATRRSPLVNFAAYGAPRHTPDLEGFLFPDTYQVRVPIQVNALVNDQLTRFKQAWAGVNLGYARSHGLSPYELLIVASMVEKEAETQKDRPLIASVIYNRLRAGMLLQIDATVRYAVNNYKSPITESQLHTPSPFNTYVQKGLPPTPIANPGLDSIQAAAHPASTSYLFFVVKPCGNGEHAFASTYAQFLQEEQQYNAARTQHGGHSPAHC